MWALEIATSVRNVRELGRLSMLFLIVSTLPPLTVKTGSGLVLLGVCELPESVRRVFLWHCVGEQLPPPYLRMKDVRIKIYVHVGATDSFAIVVDDPIQGHFLL